MTNVQKRLIKLIALASPLLWLGLTIPATCVTWWHGYTWAFFCAVAVFALIAIPAIFLNYKSYYIFGMLIFITGSIFNFYALVLLFFPRWNGWGQWNSAGDWTFIHFDLPANVNYSVVGLLIGLFLIFGIKKMFEVDYPKMEKSAYKEHMFDRCAGLFYINRPAMCPEFNVHFLKRIEHWLHAFFFTIMFLFLPFKALGSSMARNGNTLLSALFFFLGTYFLMWILYWFFLGFYAQYRLINEVEKELGVKLKPALKDD